MRSLATIGVYAHVLPLDARPSDTSPKEEFTPHNAGLDGSGQSSYIDAVVMRDKDANTAWATAAADGVLEERRYYCQNWRGDVSAVVTSAGKMVEWVKYSAYGIPSGLPCGDTDSDGDWDATDSAAITGTLDARKDCELDGDVDASDITQANAITGGYQTLGRTVMSSSSVANRKGYAGYENDGSIWRLDHVRYRVLNSELGRWLQRDPAGYADEVSLYEYVQSMAILASDPTGLATNGGIGVGPPCNPGNGGGIVVPMGIACGGPQLPEPIAPIPPCPTPHPFVPGLDPARQTVCKDYARHKTECASRDPRWTNPDCLAHYENDVYNCCLIGQDPSWTDCEAEAMRKLSECHRHLMPGVPGDPALDCFYANFDSDCGVICSGCGAVLPLTVKCYRECARIFAGCQPCILLCARGCQLAGLIGGAATCPGCLSCILTLISLCDYHVTFD